MLDILSKFGLKFEELTRDEKEEYTRWLSVLDSRPLSVTDVQDSILRMREAVELELVDTDEFIYIGPFRVVNRRHISLKARLKNYILWEAFFTSKERAKRMLEQQIESRVEGIRSKNLTSPKLG